MESENRIRRYLMYYCIFSFFILFFGSYVESVGSSFNSILKRNIYPGIGIFLLSFLQIFFLSLFTEKDIFYKKFISFFIKYFLLSFFIQYFLFWYISPDKSNISRLLFLIFPFISSRYLFYSFTFLIFSALIIGKNKKIQRKKINTKFYKFVEYSVILFNLLLPDLILYTKYKYDYYNQMDFFYGYNTYYTYKHNEYCKYEIYVNRPAFPCSPLYPNGASRW